MSQATVGLSSLEGALLETEREAAVALSAATRVQTLAKKVQNAARVGDLRELRKNLDSFDDALRRAGAAMEAVRASWSFTEADEESYLGSADYLDELLNAAAKAGLSMHKGEGVLASYPSLVRIQPKDRSVRIDRSSNRQLRPSHLVNLLLERQKKPSKVNLPRLVEALLAAYELETKGKRGEMVKVRDLYSRLTVLPWVRSEYSEQEFARDLYLLDASPDLMTKDGSRYRLHPGATGAKNRSNLLVVVTREGVERTYYGIEFTEARL